MSARHLVLLIDARGRDGDGVRSWCATWASQCLDLISIARIQSCRAASASTSSTRPLVVSLHVIRDGAEAVPCVQDAVISASRSSSMHGGSALDGFATVVKALNEVAKEVREMRVTGPAPCRETPPMRPITRFVYALHQRCASAQSTDAAYAPTMLVVASAVVPYEQAFRDLSQLCSAGLALSALDCVVADTAAVCLTSALLGTCGQLWRCSLSPTESRVALETALDRWLHAYGLTERCVACRVRCGYLSFGAVAERPYVATLAGCVSMADFPAVQQECPGLVLCGTTPVVSPFELTRHAGQSVAVLSLVAVLSPRSVDDTWLCGSAWVVSLPATHSPQELAVVGALYDALKGDALLFTTTQPHLDLPHALSLSRSCFVGYFLDEDRLFLRQVIPSELRAECVTAAESARSRTHRRRAEAPDPTLIARAHQVREEIVEQSNHANMWEVLSGGVVSVAAQLSPDTRFHLRLTR